MAIIYIDATNGNDTTGAGTSGNPYASLSKAFTVVAAGDTIKVANTSAQAIGALALPAIVTTFDAALIIEGWDNGGAQVIERPWGDETAVGVIEGRFTGTLGFVKLRNLKFQNYALVNTNMNASNNAWIYEGLDFASNYTFTGGQIIVTGNNTTIRFCSFRSSVGTTGVPISVNSSGCAIYGNYFYNCKNAISVGGGQNSYIASNVFDLTEGYAINLGGDKISVWNNTFIGDGSASNYGITFINTTSEHMSIFNNHFQDFSGSGSVAIRDAAQTWPTTAGTFDLVGGNSFYNNTANYDSSGNFAASIMTDLRSQDVQETSEPLVDKAGFDYSKKPTALSYGQQSIFQGWQYTETLNNMTTGAVQNEAGGGETSYVCG